MLALVVAGCESGKRQVSGEIGSASGFAGAVAADEPRAVLAARDALAADGSAADAAVALYFTLAVTLPSSAGLGSGGVCMVREPRAERPYVLEFFPRASADGSIGLPGTVRAMATLHAQHGRIRWTQLLAPAEELARGTSVSRALAADLARYGHIVRGDPEMSAVFVRADGSMAGEGDGMRQLDLAGTISQIRRDGAGTFYGGPLSIRLALAAQEAGVRLPTDVLRRLRPEVGDALTVGMGERAAYFAAPPADGGLFGAQLAAMLAPASGGAADADAERAHRFVEASKRALAETVRLRGTAGNGGEGIERLSTSRLQSLMEDYDSGVATPISAIGTAAAAAGESGATSFVVADADGLAIACEVTLNRPFGTGRLLPGTGIILAAPPGSGGFPLGPVIAVDPRNRSVDFAAGGSGGAGGTTGLVAVLLGTVGRGESLESAMAAKRVHYVGNAVSVAYEEGIGEAVVTGLTQRGHAVQAAGALGRVNALWCRRGLPRYPESCEVRSDPRGSGLAVIQTE
jgi:gamma-glutamyltranspeptidase/glutathione hydrolase